MNRIESWIDAFRPANGPPPQNLRAFMGWCLSGAWPVLVLAALLSAGAGAMEAGTAYILGLVIDTVIAAGTDCACMMSKAALNEVSFGVSMVHDRAAT